MCLMDTHVDIFEDQFNEKIIHYVLVMFRIFLYAILTYGV